MELEIIEINRLKVVDKFLLSFPLKPELYEELAERFFGYPLIIVNPRNEILFGIDLVHWLKESGQTETPVLKMNITDKEALFLSYNLKEKYTGLNLYEKLVFIKKVLPLADKGEIYSKTGLDVNMNRPLLEKLDRLLEGRFKTPLIQEKIILKSAVALCGFASPDREALLTLFENIPFTSSQQLKILEMAEEILFRDKCLVSDIFKKIGIDPATEKEKPQRTIIGMLFEFRNPLYAAGEKKWQEEINALELPNNMQVTHYPFFEKKQLEITVRLADEEELKQFAVKIKEKN
ncbi:MAG: hypothetical protein GY940_43905 [bacterium]|nr:hypothetical protein [bacterium]